MTATTERFGLGRKFVLALACSALAACSSSTNTPDSSSGGAPAGTGGSTSSGAGGVTGVGGSISGEGGASTGAGGAPSGAGGAALGTGGAGTGGATATACAGVFCDGFEEGTTLGAAWTVDKSVAANVVEVVSNKAHTGTNSVHMTFTTAQGATFITEKMGFPATMNSYWGRVWLFIMTPTDTGHDVYIEGSTGVNTTNTGVRPLNTQGGNISINVAPPDNGANTTMALPRGAWTCFEWQVAATGANGNVTLYMGGTLLATATNKPIPNLIEQRVGYERYATGATVGEMWIDDYAIGAARIPCN
jgi:hypothetical protein